MEPPGEALKTQPPLPRIANSDFCALMNYLDKAKICIEIEKTILGFFEVTSVYCFLNTFYVYTENFKETKNQISKLFGHIIQNLNQNFKYELIRVYAGTLSDKN